MQQQLVMQLAVCRMLESARHCRSLLLNDHLTGEACNKQWLQLASK